MKEEVPKTAISIRMVSAMSSSFTEYLDVRRDEYFVLPTSALRMLYL